MSGRPRIQYHLTDERSQTAPTNEELAKILRAADEIIFTGGRAMLAKILKGSKDKRVLEHGLDQCTSYGCYKHLTLEEITKIVDWTISHDYLKIDYKGQLPMIVFTTKGWEMYKTVYTIELYELILNVKDNEKKLLVERLLNTNRQVVTMLLEKIGDSKNIGFIRFLELWEASEVKKVKAMIRNVVKALKSV